MFNFFIIMDKIQGNNIAQNFSSEYFNYTINFIISKEFPKQTNFPDFSLVLCDCDKNIRLAKKYNLPVIALSHENNKQESLTGTSWLILNTDALSPLFLEEVYCRHHHLPLTIAITDRCIIRELTIKELPGLLTLQKENNGNPYGCFFPQNFKTYTQANEFLLNYIKNQYTFYGYGIYGILKKEERTFLGIAGFSPIENIETITNNNLDEYFAEIGYSILRQWQRQGIASEILPPLLQFGKEYIGFTQIITRIEKDNIASKRLALKNNLQIKNL